MKKFVLGFLQFVKVALLWGLTFFFALSSIAVLSGLASLFALLVALLLVPINKWQDRLKRVIPNVWIKSLLVVLLVVLMLELYQPTENIVEVEEPLSAAEITVDTATEEKEEPVETQIPAMDIITPTLVPVPASEIMSLIEDTSKEHLDYFSVEGDETGITVTMAMDGIAKELVTAASLGYDENYAPWASYRDTILDFYYLYEDLLEAKGRSDMALMVILVNDTNYDNCLLCAYQGKIVYDELAVQSGHIPNEQVELSKDLEIVAEPNEVTEAKTDFSMLYIAAALVLFFGLFLLYLKNSKEEPILPHNREPEPEPEIVYVEVLDDGTKYKTKTSVGSSIGRGLVGGAIFGPVGAVIGGATGKRKTTQHKSWSVTFLVCYSDGSRKTEIAIRGSDRYIELMKYTK